MFRNQLIKHLERFGLFGLSGIVHELQLASESDPLLLLGLESARDIGKLLVLFKQLPLSFF